MRISAIITCFNSARFIAEAVESIRRQSMPPDEIVVIDDGSTDRTGEIVRSLGGIHYFHQQNQGSSAARNAGVAAARNDWVAFLDADDLWHPQKLERQQALAAPHLRVDAIFGHAVNFQDGTPPELVPENQSMQALVPGAGLFRRDLLLGPGGFQNDFRTGEVVEWFTRMQRGGLNYVVVPDIVLYRRLHDSNKGRTERDQGKAEYLRLLRTHLREKRITSASDGKL